MTTFRLGFRGRLLATLLCLVIVAQLATAFAVLHAAREEAFNRAHEKLDIGARVLHQLILSRQAELLGTVRVLADDFGFKSAVATGDQPTLESVLANHGDRAHADLVLLSNPEGRIEAEVPTAAQAMTGPFPFPGLLTQARAEGQAASVVMYRHQAFLMVLVPVKAPQPIAWVGMGFRLDKALAQSLSRLTQLDVAFWGQDARRGTYSVATLPPDRLRRLRATFAQETRPAGQLVESPQFLSMSANLAETPDYKVDALLMLDKTQILAAYRSLEVNLMALFAVATLLSIAAAIWIARAIGRPILSLSGFAQRIGAGETVPRPNVRDRSELGLLADTLETLQERIREREARIRFQARHDSLTGLPNRTAVDEVLSERLRRHEVCVVLRFSVREFKEINDALGYRMGDEVLLSVALRMRASIGGDGYLARVGGNDFLALLPDTQPNDKDQDQDQDQDRLEARIAALRQHIEQPIRLMDSPITLHLVIGVMRLPEHADTLNRLWRRSAIAVGQSRDLSGQTLFYQTGMDESHLRELTITRDLVPALEAGHLFLLYQPKIDLRDGRLTQFEALTRWQHPDLGFIPPDEFVELAERSGQVSQLTRWVLHQSISQLSRWWEQGLDYGVAINLSAQDLVNGDLPATFGELLDGCAFPHNQITCEVTEGALIRDPERAIRVLDALKAMGLHIAIDDFGTGYSSLAQLKRLPVDELKIDKSFVLKLDSSPEDQMIVRSTIDLGHNLGVEIVAEGVESLETWRLLAHYGCDTAQGYFIAKPLPVDAIAAWAHEFDNRRSGLMNSNDSRPASLQRRPS